MDLSGPRSRWCWLLLLSVLLTACVAPAASRLVTIKLVRAPEGNVQELTAIGILPFKSPDRNVGRRLAEKVASKLSREPPVVRIVPVSRDFLPEADSLRSLAKGAEVDALLLGELTEYSVQVSRETVPMIAVPDFGEDAPGVLCWEGIQENPSVGDAFYYRLKSPGSMYIREVQVTRSGYALTLNVRLVDAKTGKTFWEQQVSRHMRRRRLPGSPVDMESEVLELQRSVVQEVVSRLRPQESRVQRMLRPLPLYKDQRAVKLVRQGIQAATRDDWRSAEEFFERAVKLTPNEASVQGNLGVVYEKSGRFLEAVAAYERAHRCQPRDPTYRYYSGDLHTAFVPDLHKQDLPTIVLGVRADGVLYLDGGVEGRHHPEEVFGIYRVEVRRDPQSARITEVDEMEIARGKIIEVRPRMSLGYPLILDPHREVRSGDVVRLGGRYP